MCDRSIPEGNDTLSSGAVRLCEAGKASLDGGVLDSKWSQSSLDDGGAILACATSTGRLALYALHCASDTDGEHGEERRADGGGLSLLSRSDAADSLLLSLDWSRGSYGDAKVKIRVEIDDLVHENRTLPVKCLMALYYRHVPSTAIAHVPK